MLASAEGPPSSHVAAVASCQHPLNTPSGTAATAYRFYKGDGKLVEINDPFSNSQECSLIPGLSDAQEGEVVHRKLEGFASQYYTILKSQLEQQRTFYENRLQEIRREFAMKERNNEKSKAEFVPVLRQERKQRAHQLGTIQ
jgi:BRCA1-associated protein